MPGFRDIVGHEKIIRHMQEAIRAGKVSHAYILNGPPGAGKKMLAEAFAMALQCTRLQEQMAGQDAEQAADPQKTETRSADNGRSPLSGGSRGIGNGADIADGKEKIPLSQIDACGTCHSCRQALGHNQPDIKYVLHEKPKIISVGEVREQLVDDAGIRPYSSRYKIYIIDEAEKMNPQAQNAILKTIEEPPSYAVILLLTDNADSFLPTIRSRCVTLNLHAVSEEKISDYLMQKYQVPDYQAQMSAAFSQGNVGLAVKLASSEQFTELKDIVISQMTELSQIPVYRLEEQTARLEDFKDQTQEYLDLIRFWFRDVLFLKAGAESAGLIFEDRRSTLTQQADGYSYRALSEIFGEIDRAQHRLRANVNRNLTLEMLLMKIQSFL